jgi:hypothetical protein
MHRPATSSRPPRARPVACVEPLLCAAGRALASRPRAGAAPRCCATPFPVAETGFDPAQITDLYSRTGGRGIFERR